MTKNFPYLFWINFKVGALNFVESLKVFFRYYKNLAFMVTDLRLLASYFGKSPYRISRRYLEAHGASNPWEYGETPLTTLEVIANTCGITSSDVFYELGCGRARSCFWMQAFIGCKVVGIEMVPEFITIAKLVKSARGLQGIEFYGQDYLMADLSTATVIYYYGTMASDDEIHALIQRLSQLKPGVKIITVSYALSDYTHERLFEVQKCFPARFTWGTADVYLQITL